MWINEIIILLSVLENEDEDEDFHFGKPKLTVPTQRISEEIFK